MIPIQTRSHDSFSPTLIAPCGMNCGICIGHLREKNHCPGCNSNDTNKPKHCISCHFRNCEEMRDHQQKFCYVCNRFPCSRLRQLDKRYRTKYGMSMLENLENILQLGLEAFVAREQDRWKCPECGGVLSVHRKECIYCGHLR
jgi:Protein of unknown function (DUF3795)